MSRPRSGELLGYDLQGAGGEVILLLNGGMMTIGSWSLVARRLHPRYRTLGCDFRGQLRSPGAGHPRIEDNVEDLVLLLGELGLESVHVLGTSFGGEVAIVLAARHPQLVRTLLIANAVDRTPPGMRDDSRRLQALCREVLAGGDPAPFHDTLVEQVYSPEFLAAHREVLSARRNPGFPRDWYAGLLGILTSIEDFDLSPCLERIHCPTLVLHAARDQVMSTERVEAMVAKIGHAQFEIHPTSGHALLVEDPDWLVAAYLEFLDRHSAPVMSDDRGQPQP